MDIINENAKMIIPSFGSIPAASLDVSKTREVESRILEIKTVNPATFPELNHMVGESYREMKKHIATVGFHIQKTEQAIDEIKSELLLDEYAEFLEKHKALKDSADVRMAFYVRNEQYKLALDRLAMLKAIEKFIEGKIKVMERATSFMNKRMDLILRSGLGSQDLYVTRR